MSCVALKERENISRKKIALEQMGVKQCLIVGRFHVWFPNGYTDSMIRIVPYTTYDRGVKLYFYNITQNTDLIVDVQSDGYYSFLCNGTDKYLFKSFRYTKNLGSTYTCISGEINIEINSVPFATVYLGHSMFIFSNHKKDLNAQKLKTDWNRIAAFQYVRNNFISNDSPTWLKYNLVENRFDVEENYTGEVTFFVFPPPEPNPFPIDQFHLFGHPK
jgi:hypothetical protein